mmetsp:Transcript_1025/g.1278  ORF Transcript_1025/g.1278 Transcript_1025/m.1278 type:complete len:172 (+) Transcript_1025:82-597(+)
MMEYMPYFIEDRDSVASFFDLECDDSAEDEAEEWNGELYDTKEVGNPLLNLFFSSKPIQQQTAGRIEERQDWNCYVDVEEDDSNFDTKSIGDPYLSLYFQVPTGIANSLPKNLPTTKTESFSIPLHSSKPSMPRSTYISRSSSSNAFCPDSYMKKPIRQISEPLIPIFTPA